MAGHSRERIERGIKVILLAILPVNEWPRDRISDSEKDGKSLTLIWVAHIRNSSGISDSEKDGKSLTLIWVGHIRNSSGS
jgi:hypothetical protein